MYTAQIAEEGRSISNQFKEMIFMSVEENKALVRRLFEAWNTGNMDLIDELLIPDYVDNDALPGQTQGLEGYKQIVAYLLSVFPDMKMTIDDLIAEVDKVVVHSTFSGTHKGEFMGIAPTGKKVTAAYINIYHIADGKFVEEWSGRRRSSPDLVELLKD